MSMLFISVTVRMNRILPFVDEGEIVPKTASWRSHQGPTARRNSPKLANAAHHGIAGRSSPCERQARQRSHRKTMARAAPMRMPSFRARDARPTSSPAMGSAQRWPSRARVPSQIAAAPSGW